MFTLDYDLPRCSHFRYEWLIHHMPSLAVYHHRCCPAGIGEARTPIFLMTKQPCPLLIQLPGESRHRSSLPAQTHLTLLNTTSVHSKFITGWSVCKELNLESRQNCCHKTCSFDILRQLCTISDEEKWVPTLSEKHLSGFELTISI